MTTFPRYELLFDLTLKALSAIGDSDSIEKTYDKFFELDTV
ncbi:MAG TPA: hypothetical protein VGD64_02020 [Acidisarcina sp.]